MRANAASPVGRRLSASYAGDPTHRDKLDSDKFGKETEDQTGGLIESWTRLKLSISYFALCNMIYLLYWFCHSNGDLLFVSNAFDALSSIFGKDRVLWGPSVTSWSLRFFNPRFLAFWKKRESISLSQFRMYRS